MRHGTGLVCPAYDRIVCVGACTPCHARCVGTRRACVSGKQVIVGWVAGERGKGREERQKVYEKLRRIDGVYGNTEKGVFRKEGVGAPA